MAGRRACVEPCGRAFGRLDLLANVAGVLVELAPVEDDDLVRFDRTGNIVFAK